MSVLSDREILQGIEAGVVVIHPFNRKNLSTSSYDVRLGENFYREQSPKLVGDIFNIFDPKQVDRVWGKPMQALTLADHGLHASKFAGIDPEDKVILLEPGETILGHTEEFIGARTKATTMMKARSSAGRCFIGVCKCAGWGDVGYFNRWTMEITNFSQHYAIPLVVGMRVAQIVFEECGPLATEDYVHRGHYQTSRDLGTVMRAWCPEMMLPRMTK